MATSFDIIEDRALMKIDDHKLTKLFQQSPEGFRKWCDGFLINAIPNFFKCRQSLDFDTENREFNSDLTEVEISILADFWVIEWFKKELQDSTKINVLLQTSGSFKTHAAAPNLNAKSNYIDGLREKVYQKITQYVLQHIDDIPI